MSDMEIEVARRLKQWKFGSVSGASQIIGQAGFEDGNGRNLNLYNNDSGSFLQWERQSGINLGWSDNSAAATAKKVCRWFMYADWREGTPVSYGDTVALGYGTAPSYYGYTKRTVGANLENVGHPAFQWQILGGKIGDPVKVGEWVAIYNIKAVNAEGQHGDFFIRHERAVGANVGWTSSPDHSWSAILQYVGKKLASDGYEILKKAGTAAVM